MAKMWSPLFHLKRLSGYCNSKRMLCLFLCLGVLCAPAFANTVGTVTGACSSCDLSAASPLMSKFESYVDIINAEILTGLGIIDPRGEAQHIKDTIKLEE